MSELSQKLHYKLEGSTDEISLYSTLGEVNNKGLNVKVNGINVYAGYGTAADGEVSRMNYKPPTEVAQKVLKQAGEPVLLNLLGYRNNEDLLQALPVTQVTKGSYIHFNNENVPTISGYDFVCAVPNFFFASEDITIKLYYIPQSVPDRTKEDWRRAFVDATGDLSKADFANTFNATNMSQGFRLNRNISKAPKLNTSNITDKGVYALFMGCSNLEEIFPIDTSNATILTYLFSGCFKLDLSKNNANRFDLTNATALINAFASMEKITADNPVYFVNVPRTLDLSNIGTGYYIVENYID